MEYSSVQLSDLPDEILLIIFKSLNNVQLLYSLFGVNKRFNQILHDPILTSHLNFLSNDSSNQISLKILDRFCSSILPEIHDKIQWIDLESLSMERILLTTNYSQLSGLGLYKIEQATAIDLLSGCNRLIGLFANEISSLVIDVIRYNNKNLTENVYRFLFRNILTIFIKLKYLNFCPSSYPYQGFSFNDSSPTVRSSSLLELHVNLESFTDCLYILDGRFSRLQRFNVNISYITSPLLKTIQGKLLNLRSFSLHCDLITDAYEELILPLLHRMLNLENLDLYLVCEKKRFIDGNDLKKNILNKMPRLDKFVFNICSHIYLTDENAYPSNEDIQNTFKDFKYEKIISCVDYSKRRRRGECLIYSYPYRLKVYKNITNNFPGGCFPDVHDIFLFDERPFQYAFFLRISQSFPFVKRMILTNSKSQNDEEFLQSKSLNEDLSIIEYPHLLMLNISEANEDYAELFLTSNKVCFPNNVFLLINYVTLYKVTQNFTKETTRINCAKLGSIYFRDQSIFAQHSEGDFFQRFKKYCPNTEICLQF